MQGNEGERFTEKRVVTCWSLVGAEGPEKLEGLWKSATFLQNKGFKLKSVEAKTHRTGFSRLKQC